ELALHGLRTRTDRPRVGDVGTGTGAVAVAIAKNAPAVPVLATDTSSAALEAARRNIERHGLIRRVELHQADLLESLGRFHLIVANLPYVSEAEWSSLPPEIRKHEPREALVAGPRGAEIIERLLRDAPSHLASGGLLVAEIGASQSESLLS